VPPRSRKKQVFVLILGGFVLAFGGCLLFATELEGTTPVAGASMLVGAIIFILGTALCLWGIIKALVILIRKLFGTDGPPGGSVSGAPPTDAPSAPPS
jgi:hypothetical protein